MSTNKKAYITMDDVTYTIDKQSINKDLYPVPTRDGEQDGPIFDIYDFLCDIRGTFINYISKVQDKINKKSTITSVTVNNLRNYITKFQNMKDELKNDLRKAEEHAEMLSELLNSLKKEIKTTNDKAYFSKLESETKNELNTAVKKELNNLEKETRTTNDKAYFSKLESETKSALNNFTQTASILSNQIFAIKNFTRGIKFEALNSFGEASIKTINNCINNFIKTFNLQIGNFKKALEENDKYKKSDTFKKMFTSNSALKLLDNIEKSLSNDQNDKNNVRYWIEKWMKFADNKNILETQNLNLTNYDEFLSVKTEGLKKNLTQMINKLKTANTLDYGTAKKILDSFFSDIQKFKESLSEHLKNKTLYANLPEKCLDALFKLGMIRCSADLHDAATTENFKNLNCISYASDVISRKFNSIIKSTIVGIGSGILITFSSLVTLTITIVVHFATFGFLTIPISITIGQELLGGMISIISIIVGCVNTLVTDIRNSHPDIVTGKYIKNLT